MIWLSPEKNVRLIGRHLTRTFHQMKQSFKYFSFKRCTKFVCTSINIVQKYLSKCHNLSKSNEETCFFRLNHEKNYPSISRYILAVQSIKWKKFWNIEKMHKVIYASYCKNLWVDTLTPKLVQEINPQNMFFFGQR